MSILEVEKEIETKLSNSLPEILFNLFQELEAEERLRDKKDWLVACPKYAALNYYVWAKLKLHKAKKLLNHWQDVYWDDKEKIKNDIYYDSECYLPIATSMNDLIRKIYDLRSEYYGTDCKCGRCNPAHTGELLERSRMQAQTAKRYAVRNS